MKLSKMQIDAIVNKVASSIIESNNTKKKELLSEENYNKWCKKNTIVEEELDNLIFLAGEYKNLNYNIRNVSNYSLEDLIKKQFEFEVLKEFKQIEVKKSDIENKIILQSINKDFDVDVFIQQLINEFSN